MSNSKNKKEETMIQFKKHSRPIFVPVVLALAGVWFVSGAPAQQPEMTFFITSEGPGDGANLGGLEGADEHCADLADDAGSKLSNWKAYLSVSPKIDRSSGQAKVIP